MTQPQQGTTYGPYAAVYNRDYGPRLPPLLLPVLDKLLCSRLPPAAELLDLCCGTGHITGALHARGYRMTGIDICPEMLAFARVNAPECRFLLADARDFDLPAVHHGALSTADSVNHIVDPADLVRVFANVHRSLRDGAHFVFDALLAEDYQPSPQRVFAKVEPDYVMVNREEFAAEEKLSRCETTLFYRSDEDAPADGWRRWDSTSWERLYTAAELESALAAAGFDEIRIYRRGEGLGMDPLGRTYIEAVKPGG
jgi:SAM-dependent methyltransferase